MPERSVCIPKGGRVDVEAYQGDTWQLVIYFERDGVPIDLTGYTAKMQVRAGRSSSATLLADAICTIGSPTLGRIDVEVPKETMAGIAAGRYWWDVQVTSGAGVRTTLAFGEVLVLPEITSG
ncbi:MAG: hypothetical protein ACK4WH_01035 [Phycisphaerales bacterium]